MILRFSSGGGGGTEGGKSKGFIIFAGIVALIQKKMYHDLPGIHLDCQGRKSKDSEVSKYLINSP